MRAGQRLLVTGHALRVTRWHFEVIFEVPLCDHMTRGNSSLRLVSEFTTREARKRKFI